jgi:hypothetical protein
MARKPKPHAPDESPEIEITYRDRFKEVRLRGPWPSPKEFFQPLLLAGGKQRARWHDDAMAVASGHPTEALQKLWSVARRAAEAGKLDAIIVVTSHRVPACAYVVGQGRACARPHLHWQAAPGGPLRAVTQGHFFKYISTHSPRRKNRLKKP